MDQLDKDILEILQADGRKSNAEIARELDLAASTVLERTRKLEERQVIKGYHADIDPAALGLEVQGFISVILKQHDLKHIKRFEKDILSIKQVKACYHLTGHFDYLLHIAVRDLAHLGELVKGRIAGIGGIGKAETFLVLSEVKANTGWPIEDILTTVSNNGDNNKI